MKKFASILLIVSVLVYGFITAAYADAPAPIESLEDGMPSHQAMVDTGKSRKNAPVAQQSVIGIDDAKTNQPVVTKKRRTTTLPGVGSVKIDSRLMHGNVIRTTGDGTENVLVSSRFPNRFATPFDSPRVIDQSGVSIVKDGSSVYVSPKKSEPIALFITGSNPGDPVISLTLIPKDIPSQIVTLQIDSSQKGKLKSAKLEGYTQQVVDLLRTVGAGVTPEGYSEGVMPNIIAKQKQGGLVIIPEVRYSGSSMDIYKYRVENEKDDIELSESSFYQKGVRAVAILPNTVLKKGQQTTVLVLADKSILDDK